MRLTTDHIDRARDALRNANLWRDGAPLDLSLASSELHSNVTIKARCDAGCFAVRALKQRDELFIDRDDERRALSLAWRIGIGAEPVHMDASNDVLTTRWINDATPLSADLLARDRTLVPRLATTLAQFHRAGDQLTREREPAMVLATYQAQLARGTSLWPSFVDEAVQGALAALQRLRGDLTPCHGDPAPSNFLNAPGGLRLIDWEYACMSDPAWDLGYVASEAAFDRAEIELLALAYDDAAMTTARVAAASLVASAVSLVWIALQARASSSPATSAAIATRRETLTRIASLRTGF